MLSPLEPLRKEKKEAKELGEKEKVCCVKPRALEESDHQDDNSSTPEMRKKRI